MNQILRSQGGAILPARDYPLCQSKKCFFYIINPLLTQREVKMAGYWPGSSFCLLTPSRSTDTQKITWPISSSLDLTLG